MSCHILVLEWIYTLQLPECQGTGCSKQTRYWKLKRLTLKFVCDKIKTYCQMHHTNRHSQHSSIIWQVGLNGWVFVYELGGCGFQSRCNHLNFRYRACLSKQFLGIQATAECRFTLKQVCDMIKNTQPKALASLAKWLCVHIGTKWLWIRIPL